MADEKLNTGPAENISRRPPSLCHTRTGRRSTQRNSGPAIPESGDVVVSFDQNQ